jgi:hypothetical protein
MPKATAATVGDQMVSTAAVPTAATVGLAVAVVAQWWQQWQSGCAEAAAAMLEAVQATVAKAAAVVAAAAAVANGTQLRTPSLESTWKPLSLAWSNSGPTQSPRWPYQALPPNVLGLLCWHPTSAGLSPSQALPHHSKIPDLCLSLLSRSRFALCRLVACMRSSSGPHKHCITHQHRATNAWMLHVLLGTCPKRARPPGNSCC